MQTGFYIIKGANTVVNTYFRLLIMQGTIIYHVPVIDFYIHTLRGIGTTAVSAITFSNEDCAIVTKLCDSVVRLYKTVRLMIADPPNHKYGIIL